MNSRKPVAALLAVLLLAATGWAQNTTGSIVGTVTDPSGAVVPGATVSLSNTDTNVVVRVVKTDDSGNYSAPLLPIGHYSLTVEAPGFAKWVQKDIELNVNAKRTVNAQVQVSATAEQVVVKAPPLQVELQSPTASTLVSGTQIRELALTSRNYAQLVSLVPGVSSTGTTEQIYVGAFSPEVRIFPDAVQGFPHHQEGLDRGSPPWL